KLSRLPFAPEGGLLAAVPKYVLSSAERGPRQGTTVLYSAPGGLISVAPPGLPFAFVADPQHLPYGEAAGARAVADGLVVPAGARCDGPNQLVVRVPAARPGAATTLVVMQTWDPGWSAHTADGAGAATRLTGGFVGVDGVRPGQTYVLRFRSAPFVAGA